MKIQGFVSAYIFHNEENTYSIAKLDIGIEEVTICGYFPKLDSDFPYSFEGDYVNHPKYGKQFKVETYNQVINESKEGIVGYLSSDIFKGIGPKTAELIYDTFGPDCINMILDNESILESIGFNQNKISRFYDELLKNQGMQKILVDLYKYGLSSKMALRLYQVYGLDAIKVLEDNPYRLISEVEGYSFTKADDLALKIGFSYDNPTRIEEAILFSLSNVSRTMGDTYLFSEQLLDATSRFLMKKHLVERNLLKKGLDSLIEKKSVVLDANRISLPSYYYAERYLADKVKSILKNTCEEVKNFDSIISTAQKVLGIDYTSEQKKAIYQALVSPISIITGGPGTGKTTVIKGILHIYQMLYSKRSIGLMAPTGRAAKRMFESTNHLSATIHRHLGMDYSGKFEHDESNPLPFQLVIIDETSMIDVFLAKSLFQAIIPSAQIVLVGDIDQLPSVGPGMFLHDLIDSKLISVTKLEIIQRQAADSSIITLSRLIKQRNTDFSIFEGKDDLYFFHCHTDEVPNVIKAFIKKLIELDYRLIEDIQVLIPMYKGSAGIDATNELIKESFNPIMGESMKHFDKVYSINDKVLQLANNPSKGVMNGDLGVVKDIIHADEDGETVDYLKVDFDGQVVLYNDDDLKELTHAYAISIHKSQGSEYPIVILPLVKSYSIMLKRNLVYTGITRAKEKLIIIGDYEAYCLGIKNNDDIRQTALIDHLSNNKKRISIPDCYFEFFGETGMENITPYDFLPNEEK